MMKHKKQICSACGKPSSIENMMVGGWCGNLHPNCRKIAKNVIDGYHRWLIMHFVSIPELVTAMNKKKSKANTSLKKET